MALLSPVKVSVRSWQSTFDDHGSGRERGQLGSIVIVTTATRMR
jgi:hypothetical protein